MEQEQGSDPQGVQSQVVKSLEQRWGLSCLGSVDRRDSSCKDPGKRWQGHLAGQLEALRVGKEVREGYGEEGKGLLLKSFVWMPESFNLILKATGNH